MASPSDLGTLAWKAYKSGNGFVSGYARTNHVGEVCALLTHTWAELELLDPVGSFSDGILKVTK